MIYRYCDNNYPEDPVRMLNFTASSDIDFFYGVDAPRIAKTIPRSNKKRVLLTLERSHDFDKLEDDFDEILMIHKFYDAWRRNLGTSKSVWKYVYFPVPERVANAEVKFDSQTRKYDVAYAGFSIPSQLNKLLVDPIFNFKYAFISMMSHPLVTHHNVDYDTKLSVLRTSKTAVVHNVLWESPFDSDSLEMRNYVRNNLKKSTMNYAWFDGIGFRPHHPELKSRIFEAASSGCIPLVMKDEFGSAEDFFKEGEDFIYFEKSTLHDVIKEVSTRYNDYSHIAKSAKEKCLRYTDTSFSKDYLR